MNKLYNSIGMSAEPAPPSPGFSTSMVTASRPRPLTKEQTAECRLRYLRNILSGKVNAYTEDELIEANALPPEVPHRQPSETEIALWKSLYSLSKTQSPGPTPKLKSRKAPQDMTG